MLRHDQEGSAVLSFVLGLTLLFVGAVAALQLVTDLSAAAARARTAADAAALAGMAASPLVGGAGDPEALARAMAARNGAVLVRLDERHWPLRLGVTVRGTPTSPLLAPFAVRLNAAAGVRPRGATMPDRNFVASGSLYEASPALGRPRRSRIR